MNTRHSRVIHHEPRRAGLDEGELNEQARDSARLEIARNRSVLDAAVLDGAVSTSEVAALLGRSEASVRRSHLSGDLYALNAGEPSGPWFPRWQFTSTGSVVPGLSRILPRFPRHTHPLMIERLMTQGHEALEGMSPIEWLTGDGPIDPIVVLVDDLGYA